jgi:hypothetical protein
MRNALRAAALLAAAARFGLFKSTPAGAAERMQISRDGARPPEPGPHEFFTGEVMVKPLFDAKTAP